MSGTALETPWCVSRFDDPAGAGRPPFRQHFSPTGATRRQPQTPPNRRDRGLAEPPSRATYPAPQRKTPLAMRDGDSATGRCPRPDRRQRRAVKAATRKEANAGGRVRPRSTEAEARGHRFAAASALIGIGPSSAKAGSIPDCQKPLVDRHRGKDRHRRLCGDCACQLAVPQPPPPGVSISNTAPAGRLRSALPLRSSTRPSGQITRL